MVTRKEKLRATQFLADRLEQSEFYEIRKRDDTMVLVREKHVEAEEAKTIKVVIPNVLGSIEDFRQSYRASREQGLYVAPMFYKDGKTSFVRMVERNLSWRTEKSLKNYTAQQINQMLHLRGIEKTVLEQFGDELAYYQPGTANLQESLRIFEMGSVDLDYSHVGPGDQGYGFVEDRESIDYKLPEEIEAVTGAARVTFAGRQPDLYRHAWLAPLDEERVPFPPS